ncbi:MAG TPA: AI-2E family transporter [Solirubrobacteraceae bacterium]|nr:AI-2E family transporter [Solirubrobacteraceae bacterium]
MRQVSTPRLVFQAVLVVVGVVVALYLIYLLRRPIGWVLIAGFLALALAAPVNVLARRIRRGFAITIVYLGLLLIPILLAAIIVPPIVTQVDDLARDVPRYAADLREFVGENERLREIDQDYDITGRIEEEAGKLPGRVGDAAAILGDIGLGLVNSIFAGVTILVLAAFMLGSGPRWRRALLGLMASDRAARLDRVMNRIANAVAGYVAGAMAIALIAATLTFIVLTMLGVPFAGPLAVLAGLLSLIPLVGATIAAVIIGLVTLFNDFPTDTIIWTVWAILYQQLENNLVQPQIQRRTVDVQPFVVLVAVLFGSALLGVLGALVAIPIAASIQIVIREWWTWRQEERERARQSHDVTSTTGGRPDVPPPEPTPA